MPKNKLAVYYILLVLGLPSCQQNVTENTLIPTIKPTVTPSQIKSEEINTQQNKTLYNFSQRRLILFSDLIYDPEGKTATHYSNYSIEILGKNNETEKTINPEKLNNKIGSSIKISNNKLLFSDYSFNNESYFSIFDIETEQETRIPVNKDHGYIVWSHNDDKFCFFVNENDKGYLYLSDLKGNLKKLSEVSKDTTISEISWSTDDKKIIYRQNNKDIYIINTDGSNLKTLLHNDSIQYDYPKLSYDNKYLSYFSSLNSDTFIMNLENGNKQRIGYGSDVIWTPNENKFLFKHHDGASHFLDYIDPENIDKKVTLVPDITSLSFNLDKNEIFYSSYEGSGFINYKTMEKKTFNLDKDFEINSVSPDGNKNIDIKNLDYRNPDDTLPSSYKNIGFVFTDLKNEKSFTISTKFIEFNIYYDIKWSKDSKMAILDSGNTIYSVNENKIINVTNRHIAYSVWLD